MRISLVRSLILIAAIASGLSAQRRAISAPALPPAPFAQPEFDAVFRYDSFQNRILGGEGLVTRYVDGAGRGGARFGVFFADNPASPLVYDVDTVAALFPLSTGRHVRFIASRGDLQWLYDARVVGTERITTPAGTFDTWVVETIEAPKITPSPATARTNISTFWYAPSVRNIVRLMVISTTPTGRKTLRKVELRSIVRHGAAAR